jgi:hypothetical protein
MFTEVISVNYVRSAGWHVDGRTDIKGLAVGKMLVCETIHCNSLQHSDIVDHTGRYNSFYFTVLVTETGCNGQINNEWIIDLAIEWVGKQTNTYRGFEWSADFAVSYKRVYCSTHNFGFLQRRPWFDPQAVRVVFVVVELALEYFFFQSRRFFLSVSFYRWSVFNSVSSKRWSVCPLAAAVHRRRSNPIGRVSVYILRIRNSGLPSRNRPVRPLSQCMSECPGSDCT